MKPRVLAFLILIICFVGCGNDSSPVASTNNSSPESEYYATKSASHDQAMREFQRVYEQVWKILTDLKRYIPKDPPADRHDNKVKGKYKKLGHAQRRLDSAFKNVRYESSAQADMMALRNHRESVLSRLGKYNLSYGFMINPCTLPWIGELLCPCNPTRDDYYIWQSSCE